MGGNSIVIAWGAHQCPLLRTSNPFFQSKLNHIMIHNLNWIRWAPWHRYKDDPEMDGAVPEGVDVEDNVR